MTEEQITIVIAESLGLKNVRIENHWQHGYMIVHGNSTRVPDYPTDRNACAEFEAKLKEDGAKWVTYCNTLALLCGGLHTDDSGSFVSHMSAIDAPPNYRCEAYLRTIGKWKESMFVDASGHDHRAVRCEEMIDIDCDTKHVGEKATCCVCAGHGCEAARQERIKHPKQNNTKA